MSKKIFCILICFLLISIIGMPVISSEISIDPNRIIQQSYLTNIKIPGYLDGEVPILKTKYFINIDTPEKEPSSYNDDLVSLFQQLNENIYLGYLENITAFGPRETGTPACDAAGIYIATEFDKLGLDVRNHSWSEGGLTGTNIEATYYGQDTTSDEIYIICAHYDSVDVSPGADDDGSGTAAVMSAARIMVNAEFNNTIRFVAFSGEEQGLYGSYYYVQEAVQNNDNIIAVLNADMIGYAETPDDASKLIIFDDEDASIWITDYIESMAEEYFSIFGLNIIRGGWSWGSDHYYFWQAGYHAIFAHEYRFNIYWHLPDDIIENMDIDYAIRNSKLLIATLAELSEFITLNAPYRPNKPAGPPGGKVGEEYIYTAVTTDPQGDQIFYLFDWGDGTNSGWIGPYASGGTAEASHTWTTTKKYNIKVKAKDTNEYESEFSDPLEVNMPRIKAIYSFLQMLLERFPLIEQLFLILFK